jgi:hypothetical protein
LNLLDVISGREFCNYVLAAQSFRAAAHIVLRDIVQEWNKLPWTWKVAANQLTIMSG